MKPIERLFVSADGVEVGQLALGAKGAIGFEYSVDWLKSGYSLSPYRLRFDNSVAKNFSYTHDGRWRLAPAYDLTFSRGIGEPTTAMMGSGLPTQKQLDALAAKFEVADAGAIQQSIRDTVKRWPTLAADTLPKRVVADCAKRLENIDGRVFGG